jgi:hypothetical protein
MSWFTDLFSAGVSGVVTSVGDVIDKLHTSDEEKLIAKQAVLTELNKFKEKQLEYQSKYDKEVTLRWQSDNEHIITRLVRPISYACVLFLFGMLVMMDGNFMGFTVSKDYIPVIEGLLTVMTVAYFGSRGIEKVTKMVKQ